MRLKYRVGQACLFSLDEYLVKWVSFDKRSDFLDCELICIRQYCLVLIHRVVKVFQHALAQGDTILSFTFFFRSIPRSLTSFLVSSLSRFFSLIIAYQAVSLNRKYALFRPPGIAIVLHLIIIISDNHLRWGLIWRHRFLRLRQTQSLSLGWRQLYLLLLHSRGVVTTRRLLKLARSSIGVFGSSASVGGAVLSASHLLGRWHSKLRHTVLLSEIDISC